MQAVVAANPEHAEARHRIGQFKHQEEWRSWSTNMKGYVATTDASERRKAYDAFRQANPRANLAWEHFERMVHYSKQPTGTLKGNSRVQLKRNASKYAGDLAEYVLATASDYDPFVPHPLVISLHGGGRGEVFRGDGQEYFFTDLIEKGWIVVAPTALRQPRSSAWGYPYAVEYIKDVLGEVSANYFVDPDRVFLEGWSMGGGGAYYIGSHIAPLLAGIVITNPDSEGAAYGRFEEGKGCVDPARFAYLRHTPIYHLQGDRDAEPLVQVSRCIYGVLRQVGCPVTYVELVGIGHKEVPREDLSRRNAWMLEHRRPKR